MLPKKIDWKNLLHCDWTCSEEFGGREAIPILKLHSRVCREYAMKKKPGCLATKFVFNPTRIYGKYSK